MINGLTELVFILDKSGSMCGLEGDTIGGFNAMLLKQKEMEGECRVTTVLFDNHYELLHDRIDIKAVRPITEKEYFTGGTTALLDAIGRTIHKIANVQMRTAEHGRAAKVLMVIITDGQENSSIEYSSERIKHMIELQKTRYGWEFIFLGANIDAVQTASRYGIAPNRAQNYHADSAGIALNFQVLNETVSAYRKHSAVPKEWNDEIQKDYKRRDGQF